MSLKTEAVPRGKILIGGMHPRLSAFTLWRGGMCAGVGGDCNGMHIRRDREANASAGCSLGSH